jgi:hypothetical protein
MWNNQVSQKMHKSLLEQKSNIDDDDFKLEIFDMELGTVKEHSIIILYDQEISGIRNFDGQEILLFALLVPTKIRLSPSGPNSDINTYGLYFEIDKNNEKHSMLHIAAYSLITIDLIPNDVFSISHKFKHLRKFKHIVTENNLKFRFYELFNDNIYLEPINNDPAYFPYKVMGLHLPKAIALPTDWSNTFDMPYPTHSLSLDKRLSLRLYQHKPFLYSTNKEVKREKIFTDDVLNIQLKPIDKSIFIPIPDKIYTVNGVELYKLTQFYIYLQKTSTDALGIVHFDISANSKSINEEEITWVFYDINTKPIHNVTQKYKVECGNSNNNLFKFNFPSEVYDSIKNIGVKQTGTANRPFITC